MQPTSGYYNIRQTWWQLARDGDIIPFKVKHYVQSRILDWKQAEKKKSPADEGPKSIMNRSQ